MKFSPLSSRRGSAILIALIVLSLLTIVTTVFLEKIWGFSKSSNGIEASNRAYYFAQGVIEQQLMDSNVNKYRPWNIEGVNTTITQYGTGARLTVYTGSSSVPASGRGNSPFDSNYNIISLGEPVQLVIPDNIPDWGAINFYFRVPQMGSAGTGVDTTADSGAILWTIGYTGASLFASGETNIFRLSDITDSIRNIQNKEGITNTGTIMQFGNFYVDPLSQYLGSNGSRCADYNCTLKLSLIRPIPTTTSGIPDGRSLPFLEYRIEFGATNLPSQFMTLHADGFAYGFMRSRTVRVPQITTNTALDFAVLQ